MAEAPGYSWYRDVYGGRASEEAFDACLPAALAVVRDLTGWNEPGGEAEEAWDRAVCAGVDALAEWGDGPASGFSIGSFSMSGSTVGATGREIAAGAARRELAASGLLWAGIA